jgi:hypothetical protein
MEVTLMLILGLLLLACTAAFVGLAIADNLGGGASHSVTILGHQIAVMNGLAIFCAGLALALVFGLGVMLAMGGWKMRRHSGRELRAARRDANEAARERDELAARLDQVHAEHEAAERDLLTKGREEDTAGPAAAPGGQDSRSAPAEAGAGASSYPPTHRRQRHLFGH